MYPYPEYATITQDLLSLLFPSIVVYQSLLVQEYRPEHNIPLVYRSDWAILARNAADLNLLLNSETQYKWEKPPQYVDARSWTDDFISIMNVWK